MRSIRLVLVLGLALQTAFAAEQSESTKIPEVAPANDVYKKTVATIRSEKAHRTAKATKDYLARLEQLRKEFTAAADLEASSAVKKEQERMGKDEDTSAEHKKAMPGQLLGFREAYERACEPASLQAKGERTKAVAKFVTDLEATEQKLTKASRMDRVRVVKALREKIVEKGEVPEHPTEPNIRSAPIATEKLEPVLAAKIKAAVEAKTVKNAATSGKPTDPWPEVPKEGALLLGFELSEASWDGVAGVKTLRPIFLSTEGYFTGLLRAKGARKLVTVKARPGYAVSGLNVYSPGRVGGFQIVFSKYDVLTAKFATGAQNTYTSKWFGSKDKGELVELRANGSLIVGVYGQTGDDVDTIGIVAMP